MSSFPLPIASYRLPSPRGSSARVLNCYVEPAPKDGTKGPAILRRGCGIREWVTLGDTASAPIRSMVVMGGTLYAVCGTAVYAINSTADTVTELTGTIPGSERLRVATNGSDIVWVRPADNTAYECDGSTVAQITDGTFVGWTAADVTFLDGYFVFRRPNSQQIFNSGLNAVTFNALDITSADGAPDNLVGLIAANRELILPGELSTELWFNAANPTGSPFSRSPSGFVETGCAAAYSVAKTSSAVFFLANDRTVRMLGAGSPTPIKVSNFGIDSVLQRLPRVDDAFAMTYTLEGHEFYVLTFPFAGRTFVFDATVREWHERDTLGLGRWLPNCMVEAYGMQLVGDSTSNTIGVLDPETFDELGDDQRVEFDFQAVYDNNRRLSHRKLELIVNQGHGTLTGQGADPLVTLKVSDDGGETFRTLPTRSLGLRGKYNARTVWHNLGSSRDRVYRVQITDPVPLMVIEAQLEVV